MKKALLLVMALILLSGAAWAAGTGVKKKRPLPYEYGRIVINNFSEKEGLAPVVFDHWLHRARFTCRLCHVDIGFAMKAGGTEMKAADNIAGYYCGTCHNGKMMYGDKTVFESCSNKRFDLENSARCDRCHSYRKSVTKEYDFNTFTQGFVRGRFGNGIDWEKTEEQGIIKPIDYLEGISMKRQGLAIQKDFALEPKVQGMPDIIFSHKKHTVWNGCEVCHPEIFIGVKKGTTKYSMAEIFDGRYCGVCHGTVAFPLLDCTRCHSAPVGAEGAGAEQPK